MNTTEKILKTTFTKDVANNKMFITREFEGTVADVWKSWTDAKLLDQWWAPKPWKAKTKSMDFREGGRWIYAMMGPEGEQHWALAEYRKIVPLKSIEALDAFGDEAGNINTEFPRMNWTIAFKSSSAGTKVEIEIKFSSKGDLEKIIEMGFQEGFTAAHDNLDELLAAKKK
jgi:uncharacterized protein YndB with AHSA1/START domain